MDFFRFLILSEENKTVISWGGAHPKKTQKIPKNPKKTQSQFTDFGVATGIFWVFLGFFGIIWDFLGLFGIIWDFLGFFWDFLGFLTCNFRRPEIEQTNFCW